MKKLPNKVYYNRFLYTLLARKGRKCLYELHLDPKNSCFEAFIPRIREEETIKGKHKYDKREIFPRDEDIGYVGKTYNTIEEAINWINSKSGPKLSEKEVEELTEKHGKKKT